MGLEQAREEPDQSKEAYGIDSIQDSSGITTLAFIEGVELSSIQGARRGWAATIAPDSRTTRALLPM